MAAMEQPQSNDNNDNKNNDNDNNNSDVNLQPNVQSDNTNEQNKCVYTIRDLKLFAFNLTEQIHRTRVRKVDGFDKFKRSVKKELSKLQEMQDETRQYSSTNIFYLTAIWNYCLELGLNNVKAVCKKIKFDDVLNDKKSFVIVDIICEHGLKWIKIKSKNPYSIQLNILKSESRSNILTVADNYINAAKANNVKFKTPKIEFVFTKGITSDVLYMLKTKFILCKGNVIEDDIFFAEDENENKDEDQDDKKEQTSPTKTAEEQKTNTEEVHILEYGVNLGPKTMMTMISALSNGELHDEFWQVVENYVIERQDNPNTYKSTIWQQALNFTYNSKVMSKIFSGKSTQMLATMVGNYYEEIQYPVLPIIMQYIGNRKIFCCQSAWDSITRLVGMGAGPNEYTRYQQLQQQITVIPDQISPRTASLNGKGMSNVNKAVFGTGDSLKMLTVAGAPSFVRKAKQKGVEFYCKIHDVRPFIEQYQVGYQIFKINRGFDVDALQRKLEEEDIKLDSDDFDDDDDDEEEENADEQNDNDNDGNLEYDEEEVIDLEEEFENFQIQIDPDK